MGKSVLYRIYLGESFPSKRITFTNTDRIEHPYDLRFLQAQALGIADRNVGKVSGRAEFYQRLKALSVAPVKEPSKGQAVIVGVPKYLQTGVAGSSRIGAIKALRELTSLGLKEAKDVIDCVDGNCVVPQANYHFPITDIETANRQAKTMREAGCIVQVNLS